MSDPDDEGPTSDALGGGEAGDVVDRPGGGPAREAPPGAPPPPSPTPSRRSGPLLAAGALLAVVLVSLWASGAFGSRRSRPAGRTPPASPAPTSASGLPEEPASHARDGAPVRWFDGARPGWEGIVDDGVWLLVFVQDLGPEAALTVKTASNLHRRIRDRGAELMLVFPRSLFLDAHGRVMTLPERTDVLIRLGGIGDLNVLLDAPAGDAEQGTLRTRCRLGPEAAIAAIVLVDGRLEHRLLPVSGGFTVEELEALALRSIEIRPAVDLPEDDEGTR